ncbi:1-(5-phosphoribosyl)-5-[(5-phosphoribosylamino)methylideneamino] imidazole-4-carboxamide isomerase [Nannocystis exedens]|uniref:1-(5-phosphoribosyl)-5-[(5-phosphoribosylamino)methylideneamino] imidazole-4-carboxamide isomerase n=1 Tax=Nannocystis exedens TaxID=54 RepID=A0A1I1UG82_9BACT|nr:HisA/HisF-related TIM barrel protein [Nannocystis exedens]PCC71679.1 1-(5-phosphoribosyl)-5-((5-phosphoribosylamino)methylideneamino)imidazole-4-carboxamide isomerase [Nannocystis exedens]SFD69714.1 1-(5-phosphoribosyl)-5-[(5-phosphoribosylamino)methylideneamino] imidazole-4-carboxamide isomerase [Nannocystis exedens]
MLAIPAIDLMGGKAVRLQEGDPRRATVYADDPAAALRDFLAAGARRVHIVDLDGAFAGRPVQTDLVRELVRVAHEGGAEVEVGGGLRDAAAVTAVLDTGADYVVVGTLAVRDPDAVSLLCRRYPGRIIVAIDARDGLVALAGWQEPTTVPALALAKTAAIWGAAALLHTDIARDGLQCGPAVDATISLQRAVPSVLVIASGGVGSLADLDALRAADVRAVVLGRALYEGSFTLEEALARC